MLSRKQLEGAMNRPPDKKGDEGEVFFLGAQPDEQVVLKRWYTQHRLHSLESAGYGKLPQSPYFAKKSFYEAKLIHELAPTTTIEITGAYDTSDGFPVTVSRRVVGDPEQERLYDAITEPANALFQEIYAQRAQGQLSAEAANTIIDDVRVKAEREVQQLVGVAITDPYQLLTDRKLGARDAVNHMLAAAKAIDPDSATVALLELGIVPAHPELNFIPGTADTHPKAPHGTFVETMLVDDYRLEEKLVQKAETAVEQQDKLSAKKQLELLKRFRIFKQLDSDFYNALGGLPQTVIDNPAAQQAVLRLLQAKYTYLSYETRRFSEQDFTRDILALKVDNPNQFIDGCERLAREIQDSTANGFLTHWINKTPFLRHLAHNKADANYPLFQRLIPCMFHVPGTSLFSDTATLDMMLEFRHNPPTDPATQVAEFTKILERLEALQTRSE